jgi:LacI family transcriptional regulator
MDKRPSVSMKDVAALAQVSVGTISNVLNKPEVVSPETRRRVLEAIDKLGWVRNESARQLRAGRSASIGLVVMDIANPFFSDMARGVEEVAAAAGCSVLLSDSAHDPARERAALELFQQLRVRGVILAPVSRSPDRELARRLDMPIVLADHFSSYNDACTVSVDDFAGGQLAAAHLLEQGHRRLAAVGGAADIPQVRDRRDGASRAVLLGSPEATLLTISTDRLDIAAGRSAAASIVAMPDDERPTGVFALNDLVAIGLLQGMVAQKVAVPEEICIVGYDDIEFAAAAAVPLSSVSQPRVELGRRAAELLLAEIEADDSGEPHQHTQERFTPALVVRASSIAHVRPAVPAGRSGK